MKKKEVNGTSQRYYTEYSMMEPIGLIVLSIASIKYSWVIYTVVIFYKWTIYSKILMEPI